MNRKKLPVVVCLALAWLSCDTQEELRYAGAAFVGDYRATQFVFADLSLSTCVYWDVLEGGGYFRLSLRPDGSAAASYDAACRRATCRYEVQGSFRVSGDTLLLKLPVDAAGACGADTMFRDSKWLIALPRIENVTACAPCGGPTLALEKQ